MSKSAEELAHLEWIGYVQPVGLIVSIPAMLEAQCYVNKAIMGEHTRFLECLPNGDNDEIIPEIRDLPEFTQSVLGWESADLVEIPSSEVLQGDMASLEVVLPQYHETLRPTYAVPAFKPEEGQSPWLMMIQQIGADADFDQASEEDSARHWNAPPQAKFERLLRETEVPIGVLSNRRQLRLVYAPKGESSGYATFNVDEMMQVAGRPMFAALQMLLNAERMFSLGENQRLPAILENSRKYQNTVSTKLAEQVLAALYELMRGFQAANDVSKGELLSEVLDDEPNHVYSGLLTVLMRLVFVMYAEDRDLLTSDPVYSNFYSVTGLFDRLREDEGQHPDTMNQRYGAWSQLVTLFRLIYEGGQHEEFKIPGRKGYLFDPDRYPFLEGRQRSAETSGQVPPIPRISDGIIFNVLRNLLVLDGERLSYRSLDVEQIGTVYETVMGFNLELAKGRSIALKPVKTSGAPATINLDELLDTPAKDRAKWLKEASDQKITGDALKGIKDAKSIEQLLEALDKKIQKKVTPRIVPEGAIVLQPSDERRRSGSHYTPRSLTEPIVRTTLEPILKQLWDPETELSKVYVPSREDKRRYTEGDIKARISNSEKAIRHAKLAREKKAPHPSQILDLKICDPAMGSGAFLVEVCRQLGDELVKAWYAHDLVPSDIPADEDEVLYARRLVAQRCLYGVDKNVMAVDLAKLSLWLVTLAKDHTFTFLDHSLRHGDSLVGLTREQIVSFHWEAKIQKKFGEELIQRKLDRATEARAKILNAREDVPYKEQERRLGVANEELDLIRLLGDACVSCFFVESKKKDREKEVERVHELASSFLESAKRQQVDQSISQSLAQAAARQVQGDYPVPAFHWEIEFPEVFSRDNGGFDAFVGNPPFLGGTKLYPVLGGSYCDYVRMLHENSGGKAVDLVAHFFRRAFNLVRKSGRIGLIATNTISQGDTREAGLKRIIESGGMIYSVIRRLRWAGDATVTVSVVHYVKPPIHWYQSILDGKPVVGINSFLFPSTTDFEPMRLKGNLGKAFQGTIVLGMGFTFDDRDQKGVASPLDEMKSLIAKDPRNKECILPYIGGRELNSSPTHAFHRYVINFADKTLHEARKWPDLIEIVEKKVKPERDKLGGYSIAERRRQFWWQFGTYTPTLYEEASKRERILAVSRVSTHLALAFLPTRMIYSDSLCLFAFDEYSPFAVMQSRIHEVWARFFCSTMGDGLRYTPGDGFDTFVFPGLIEELESAGEEYYAHRGELMQLEDQGLTEIYNRFHSPDECDSGILELRRRHGLMDEAVLRAYGWDDLADSMSCEFLLDYEEEEDEEPGAKKSKKKKPWRYRWPDEFRDEVLARLLELNEQRHKEEMMGVVHRIDEKSSNKKADTEPSSESTPDQRELF